MIKNDLALKGNIAGVELLVFPSNELPQDSQRKSLQFKKEKEALEFAPCILDLLILLAVNLSAWLA